MRSAPDTQAIQSVLDAFSDIPGAMHATVRSTGRHVDCSMASPVFILSSAPKELNGTVIKNDQVGVTRSVKLNDGRKAVLTISVDLSLKISAERAPTFGAFFS